MNAPLYTAELVCDSVFYGSFDERIAAALNAGNLTEAGRIIKEACDTNLTGQADDADRRSEAAQAFDAKFPEVALLASLGVRRG